MSQIKSYYDAFFLSGTGVISKVYFGTLEDVHKEAYAYARKHKYQVLKIIEK